MSNTKVRKSGEPIYVIAGKEDSLVWAECEKLIDKLLGPQERAVGLFKAEPFEVSAAQVFDELRTVPFLSSRRVVVIKNADKFVSENRQLLEKYFDNPSSTGILILTVSNWDSRTRLAKKLPKVGKLFSVTQPKAWQLPGRLTKYASDAHDKNLTKPAAELLIELSGDDVMRLYGEIDKLALFADNEKVITAKHVELLIGHNRIFGVFAVIDSCLAGNIAEAVSRLRNMFAEDRTSEYTVVGAFAFHFRRAFQAKALLEKGIGQSEVASRLRIWSNKEGFFSQLQKMSLEQIGAYLRHLARTDYAIKTGQTKASIAVEQLVFKLAGGS